MTDHSHEELAHKGDPSLDRLLFFSDGVFAIAITLLSIELHVPHGWNGTFASLVREGWPMVAAYVLSFAVIGVFWNAHRRLFIGMVRFSPGVFVLNLMLLGAVALMPFVTVLMYTKPVTIETFAIYLALVSLIGVLNGLTNFYAAFVADIVRPRRHPVRLTAGILMQSLMPGACCGTSLAFFAHAPWWITGSLGAIVIALVVFLSWSTRRFA